MQHKYLIHQKMGREMPSYQDNEVAIEGAHHTMEN